MKTNKGQFKKGHTPWNKNTKGLTKQNKTSFTKETVKRNDFINPVIHKRDGCIMALKNEFVKVKDKRTGKTYLHHKRISYARYVLQKAGFDIPKNHVVYHIDQNKLNNNINNLEIISRKELLQRNKKD